MARFVFGEHEIRSLAEMHSQGLTMADAAKKFGVCHGTLATAIRRSGYLRAAARLYPRMTQLSVSSNERTREMENVRFDEVELSVNTGLLQVRAAIMPWRMSV